MIEESTKGSLGNWPWCDSQFSDFDESIYWPKISIVTPSFNQGRYIEETIRSVIQQQYPNLEYIIIDGGSTDETIEIIKKYEPWITGWVSEPDKGQSHAINKGIQRCTGEIFNWLNSDDYYAPNALFKVAAAFKQNPDLEFVSGYENQIYPDGSVKLSEGTYFLDNLESTIELCEVTQPSTFFKLKSIKEIKGVSEELHYIMDGEMWIRLLLQHPTVAFKKIREVLVNFRIHENSKTYSNTYVDNFLKERCSIVTDLQRHVGVPEKMIAFFLSSVYRCPVVIKLNKPWEFNEAILSPRQLKTYFIKKYITKQFIINDFKKAKEGLSYLIKDRSIDFFLWKSLAKLMFKRIQT